MSTIPMLRIPTHQPPTHPSEMLREEFLKPLNLSIEALAQATHTSPKQLSQLTAEKANLTPSLAYSLASHFGMRPDFWLSLQACWDLYHEQRQEAKEL